MIITYEITVSFKVPDEYEKEQNFVKQTEDIKDYKKTMSTQYVMYSKKVSYNIERGGRLREREEEI